MQIDTVSIKHKNKLMDHYQNFDEQVMQFFDYHPFNQYQERVQELHERTFQRQQLANALMVMNEKWEAPQATLENIKLLTDERTVAVIGGQQAGLLTGPMYTVNKIISIIQLANQQEKELNVPVIPVFWIAGEDHDFDEINHIHFLDRSEMKKHSLTEHLSKKIPISNLQLDDLAVQQWVDQLFMQLQETEHTKELYETVQDCLNRSTTFVDFFARLLFSLFSSEGLVLVDSNDSEIRQIESDYFFKLIDHQEQIAANLFLSAQQVKQAGYSLSLDIEADDAHLFYHLNEERILLKRTDEGDWIGKKDEVKLSTDEIKQIAQETPHLLSNNVVTRPLMQELLFPTLAFIGGWGEISYWTVLQRAFHTLALTMPPVVPRLSLSYVDQRTKKVLDKYGVELERAINQGVQNEQMNWLASTSNPPIKQLGAQIKSSIQSIHKPLRTVAKQIRPDIGEMADKNVYYLQKEIDFLVSQMTKAIDDQFEQQLTEFALIEQTVHPHGGLQERVWSPISFMNIASKDFINELIQTPLSFENDHYVVFL